MNECNKPAASQSPQPCVFSHDSAHRAPEKDSPTVTACSPQVANVPCRLKDCKTSHQNPHSPRCPQKTEALAKRARSPAQCWPRSGCPLGPGLACPARRSPAVFLAFLTLKPRPVDPQQLGLWVYCPPQDPWQHGSLREVYWTWTPGAPGVDCVTSSKSPLPPPSRPAPQFPPL